MIDWLIFDLIEGVAGTNLKADWGDILEENWLVGVKLVNWIIFDWLEIDI